MNKPGQASFHPLDWYRFRPPETDDPDHGVPYTPLLSTLRYHEIPVIMRNFSNMVPMYCFLYSFINKKHYPI